MNERETANAINERAATWVALLDRSPEDVAVQAEFASWLEGDDRRRGAFLRAQAAWTMLDRASALGAGDRYNDADNADHFGRRRVIAMGGVAAAAVLAVGGAGLGINRFRLGDQIETGLGEVRQIPLKDGSLAAINTDTRLSVELRSNVRQIALSRGEAWFQVAHDRERPFIVEAGDVRVRAIGTAFAVRCQDQGADILVTEGIVESWSEQEPGRRQQIVAGERIFVSETSGPSAPIATSLQNDRELAWRTGELVFEGETIEEAAEQFNRYNQLKLNVSEGDIGQERLIGRFRLNEPDAFARAAAVTLHLSARQDGNVITLSRS